MEDFYDLYDKTFYVDLNAPRRREEKPKQRAKNRKRNKAAHKSRRK